MSGVTTWFTAISGKPTSSARRNGAAYNATSLAVATAPTTSRSSCARIARPMVDAHIDASNGLRSAKPASFV